MSKTLESLLTDVEFETDCSLIVNNTVEKTTDATENYITEEVTVDSVTVVSDMDKSLPEHSFVSNTII